MKKEIPISLIRQLFDYDPETGNLIWKIGKRGAVAGAIAGTLNGKGYIQISVNGSLYNAHRLVWALHHQAWPKTIDHINTVKTDNRIENLREATVTENARNTNLRASNTSGVKGVIWNKRAGKWSSRIRHGGKELYFGCFDKLEDAQEVTRNKRAELHGEFANHG